MVLLIGIRGSGPQTLACYCPSGVLDGDPHNLRGVGLLYSLSGLLMFLSLLLIVVLFILNVYFPDQIFELIFPPLTIFFMLLSVLIANQPIVSQEFLERSTLLGHSILVGHGTLSILGYLLFGVACLTSIFFLYQEKRIKIKPCCLRK